MAIDIEKRRREIIIDEFGALDLALRPWRQRFNRHAELAKIIRSWYDDKDGEESFTENGHRWSVTLGAKKIEAEIDTKAAYKALGRLKFIEIAQLTQKALKSVLPEAIVSTLLKRDRTGSRSLEPTFRDDVA